MSSKAKRLNELNRQAAELRDQLKLELPCQTTGVPSVAHVDDDGHLRISAGRATVIVVAAQVPNLIRWLRATYEDQPEAWNNGK